MMKTRVLITALALLVIAMPLKGNDVLTTRNISLELEAVPLVSVLNMIASQNGLNVVISGDVGADVTMHLENVDVATALDALLTANGYNYFYKGNVIVVKPADVDAAGELGSRLITLKYIDPITAQKALDSRISEKGSVVILDKSAQEGGQSEGYKANRLLITDYPNILDDLEALITDMDVAERTVQIEARIIETTVDSESNLGFSWPTSLSATLSEAEGESSSSSSTTSESDDSENKACIYNPSNGRWTWGKLSANEVGLVLNMLQQSGNSKLISDPRITTLENHEAEFKFNTVIPIQTINRFTEGAATSDIVTFEDEEIGISLKVTPRINENGKISMDILPKVEDIVGYNGPADNQKPITVSRSIQTRITVKDGETVALGGLLKENEIESVQKVPLLGHIPILGKVLFSSKSVEKNSTDLIILITPHILD